MEWNKTLGVIGAGVMGRGVAYRFAKYGYEVVLTDRSASQLEAAQKEIRNLSRMDMMLSRSKGLDIHGAADALDRIRTTESLSELAHSAFVVENITENIALKTALYEELGQHLHTDTKLAVNTSAVSITRLGGVLGTPERVMGIHFMNPVHMKHTVEVIRGYHSSEETMETALSHLSAVGMEGVVVNDYPGFVSNRVLMLTVNEAIFTLQDGVADAAGIDKIFRECFGHTMGPLATADLIGLDTILFTLDVLLESYNDPKFRPAPLLRKMVDAGLLGRKSGEGFFTY